MKSSASVAATDPDSLSKNGIHISSFGKITQALKSLISGCYHRNVQTVFFNSGKGDLEGSSLPHVSSCLFCALGSKLFYKHRHRPITKAIVTATLCTQGIKLIATIKFTVIINQTAMLYLPQRAKFWELTLE